MRARRPPWRPTIHAFLSGVVSRAELERAAAAHSGGLAAVPEHRAQRPSAYKEARKDELRGAYHAPALDRLPGAGRRDVRPVRRCGRLITRKDLPVRCWRHIDSQVLT